MRIQGLTVLRQERCKAAIRSFVPLDERLFSLRWSPFFTQRSKIDADLQTFTTAEPRSIENPGDHGITLEVDLKKCSLFYSSDSLHLKDQKAASDSEVEVKVEPGVAKHFGVRIKSEEGDCWDRGRADRAPSRTPRREDYGVTPAKRTRADRDRDDSPEHDRCQPRHVHRRVGPEESVQRPRHREQGSEGGSRVPLFCAYTGVPLRPHPSSERRPVYDAYTGEKIRYRDDSPEPPRREPEFQRREPEPPRRQGAKKYINFDSSHPDDEYDQEYDHTSARCRTPEKLVSTPISSMPSSSSRSRDRPLQVPASSANSPEKAQAQAQRVIHAPSPEKRPTARTMRRPSPAQTYQSDEEDSWNLNPLPAIPVPRSPYKKSPAPPAPSAQAAGSSRSPKDKNASSTTHPISRAKEQNDKALDNYRRKLREYIQYGNSHDSRRRNETDPTYCPSASSSDDEGDRRGRRRQGQGRPAQPLTVRRGDSRRG